MAKFTPKQKAFIKEYLIDLNATQAALRAGYSPNTARSQGQRLLTNVDIQTEIEKAMNERGKRTEISADRVLQELAKIAFSDLKDVINIIGNSIEIKNWSKIDGTLLHEVSETQNGLKVKLYDKLKALELIGKHLAMWTDRKEITGEGGGPIQTKSTIDLSKLDDKELNLLEEIVSKSSDAGEDKAGEGTA